MSFETQAPKTLADSLRPTSSIIANILGGKQSSIPFRFDLIRGIAAKAMLKLAGVLEQGAKKFKEEDNWHKVSPQEHLNHALTHAFAWLAGDTQDDHVSHFHCRAMMFAATLEDPRWNQKKRLAERLGILRQNPWASQKVVGKETYGEMLNRHHRENAEFSKVKDMNEKEFFETLYP